MINKKIYILPGWSYNISKWNKFFKELKLAGFRPTILKIPGLHSKITRPWNISDYVKWLEKELKDKKDIILLGHSNGGRIALSYTLKNSKNVSKLILIDSAGIYHNELPLRLKRILFKYLAKAGKKITKSEGLKNLLYKFAQENDYNQAPGVMKKTMQNLISRDLTYELEKIKTKTLIIWGENDRTTPLSDANILNSKIKNSELEIVQNARHSPQFTNAKEVVGLINEFLK